MKSLDIQIEALLFVHADAVPFSVLAKHTGTSVSEVQEALVVLKKRLQGALTVITTDTDAVLATNPELSTLIDAALNKEVTGELSKAALETLSIITYSTNVSRSDIDYIRGVNSNFILRTLVLRGLIERVTKGRKTYYQPTIQLLTSLGISEYTELPAYTEIHAQLVSKIATNHDEQ